MNVDGKTQTDEFYRLKPNRRAGGRFVPGGDAVASVPLQRDVYYNFCLYFF